MLHALSWTGGRDFRVDRSKLDAAGRRVAALTRGASPTLEIPYHSRWAHFEAGGVDRGRARSAAGRTRRSVAIARAARIDLTWSACCSTPAPGRLALHEPRAAGARPAARASEALGVAGLRGRFSSRSRTAAASTRRPCRPPTRQRRGPTSSRPRVQPAGRPRRPRRRPDAPRLPIRCARQPQTVPASAARPCSTVSPPHARRTDHPVPGRVPCRRRHPSAELLDAFSADLADAGRVFTACRSATSAGRTCRRRRPGRHRRLACPSTSCRSGSPIRCWNPSSGPASKVDRAGCADRLPEYRNGGLLLDAGVMACRATADATRPRLPGDEPGDRVARAHRGAARRAAPMVRARLGPRPSCRWPACSKAAPGRRARDRRRARAARRRWPSTATARCSERALRVWSSMPADVTTSNPPR